MKGFPRRGSDGLTFANFATQWTGLNEGLPQKGKRFPLPGAGGADEPRLNEGLPQKGKRCGRVAVPVAVCDASMKGFPRRGSDCWGGAQGVRMVVPPQ